MSEYIFKLPDLGEGTVEAEIGEWFVKIGDQVKEEDVVGTMMTDKAAVELSSPVSGKVVQLAGEPGDMVPVGAALVVFDASGVAESRSAATPDVKRPETSVAEAAATTSSTTPASTRRARVMTSPAVRHRAKAAGIDPALIPGTGPRGRVTRQDFDRFMDTAADSAPTVSPPSNEVKETKVIGLRRIIAERMATAAREIPHFTYVEEIDVTELESLRRHANSKISDQAGRLTLLPFIGLALIRALKEFPQCNTTYDKGRNVLIEHEPVHLGIATQTENGLKVPVVRHAEALSATDLGREIRRVSEAARNNTIKKSELSGSTITITSLGKLGGVVSTPVINQPEVGIIGVNRAVERPVVMNGQVVVRLMMNLSSSFDHRFIDGYDVAAMIQRVKEMLEHPATIYAS